MTKKGDKFECCDCGIEVECTKDCGCDVVQLLCCGKKMSVKVVKKEDK
jgi:hypothetical protein